jgi:2,3-bisphosphoglycerate-independent phosphoglycerate mutase
MEGDPPGSSSSSSTEWGSVRQTLSAIRSSTAACPASSASPGGLAPPWRSQAAPATPFGVFPLDATFGIEGTPQSGTGQSALLTGLDAGAIFGGHFGPWIPVRLRPLVEELRSVAGSGGKVAFANAYPRGWPGPNGSRRIAGPPLAARGAGVLDRHEDALARGAAVASDIVNDGWRDHLGHRHVPRVTPAEAGRNLAAIAEAHDLTLFAHYTTDTAGHRRDMEDAVTALERVDAFLGGVIEELSTDTLLLIASDHGNIEDVTTGHTRNPVMGLALGPGTAEASKLRDLREVAPFLQRVLGA